MTLYQVLSEIIGVAAFTIRLILAFSNFHVFITCLRVLLNGIATAIKYTFFIFILNSNITVHSSMLIKIVLHDIMYLTFVVQLYLMQ
jgi:hypothetical protein